MKRITVLLLTIVISIGYSQICDSGDIPLEQKIEIKDGTFDDWDGTIPTDTLTFQNIGGGNSLTGIGTYLTKVIYDTSLFIRFECADSLKLDTYYTESPSEADLEVFEVRYSYTEPGAYGTTVVRTTAVDTINFRFTEDEWEARLPLPKTVINSGCVNIYVRSFLMKDNIHNLEVSEYNIEVNLSQVLGVELTDGVPQMFKLGDNYPNPSNPNTTIPFSATSGGIVTLNIYNILGEKVAIIHNGYVQPGNYTATWDGLDSRGNQVPSGTYLFELDAGEYFHQVKKMSLVK